MRRLFALVLVLFLSFGFATPANADVAGLTPCDQSKAFLQRAGNARTPQAKERFELYAKSNVLCGTDGLPHLVVDGRLDHLGEFHHPQHFVLIHRWLDWLGRSRLHHPCPG